MYSNNLVIKDTEVAREIEKFLVLTGKKHWENIINNIENTSGIFYKQFMYIQNPLAKSINHYNILSKKGMSIRRNINADIYHLCSNAMLFNFLIKNLDEKAKNSLLGRIRSDDIRSLLFELETIIHFFRSGAKIDFVEYEGKGDNGQIYDFLVQMNDKEFEVECKYKEYDSKRKLTRPAMSLFIDQLIRKIDIQNYNCIASIEFKNTLSKNITSQNKIIDMLKEKLESNNYSKTEYEDYFLEIFPIIFSEPLNTVEKYWEVVKPYYLNNNHFVSLCSNKNNFLLRFLIHSKEKLVDGIYESLKKAPSQFSGERASIISCCIEGIYSEDWIQLKDEGGLHNMTKHFLFKEENNFIHSVLYTSKTELSIIENYSESKKPILTFKNPFTSFYKEYGTKDLINVN